jgi:hypothetical protein
LLVFEDGQQGVVVVAARRMHGHTARFFDDEETALVVSVDDANGATDDGRLVAVNHIAEDVLSSDDMVG